MDNLHVHFPPELMDALKHIAGNDDASVENLIIEAVKRDVTRRSSPIATRLDRPCALGPLRAMFAKDLALAQDRDGLEARLRRKGYYIGMVEGVLSLLDAAGLRLCETAALGYSEARLQRVFAVTKNRAAS